MNYLNLAIADLTSETFLGEEPLNRATWLCLMRYCAQQENGGVIENAESWGERKWMQLCGVTKDEVSQPSELWGFHGGNVEVNLYPINQEGAIKKKREGAGVTNANRGAKRGAKRNAERDAKGKESNVIVIEKECKENERKEYIPKATRRPMTDPTAIRIGALMRRREDTPWTDKEIKSLKSLGQISEDELSLVEWYYRKGGQYLRRDLQTLLNNWAGEVDRAGRAKREAEPWKE